MFDNTGYLILRGAISEDVCSIVSQTMEFHRSGDHLNSNEILDSQFHSDADVPHAWASYSPYYVESMLFHYKPLVEQAVNAKLLPTYSYARIMFNGSHLMPHVDRLACQFSTTICISEDKDNPWPILLKDKELNEVSAHLRAGDMLIYDALNCIHWRNRYHGRKQAQIMLHYVDANGPYSVFERDCRPQYGVAQTEEGRAKRIRIEDDLRIKLGLPPSQMGVGRRIVEDK